MEKQKTYRNIRMFNHCRIKIRCKVWKIGVKTAWNGRKKCQKMTFCILGVTYYGEYIADHMWCSWKLPSHYRTGDVITMEILVGEYPDGSGRMGIRNFRFIETYG